MKQKMFKLLLFACAIAIYFVSCSTSDSEEIDIEKEEGVDFEVDETFETGSKDNLNYENAVKISFDDDGVVVENTFSGSGVSVVETNNDVVITSSQTKEIYYVLSGITSDGSVKIYSENKFVVVMNGVSIIHGDGPALNIQSGKQATILLIEGTSNRLVDSSVYAADTNEDRKSALFSEGELVFEGKGSLEVVGRYKHGICSDDHILINEGQITISAAAKDGIHVNNYFQMEGGSLTINSLSDGIECEAGHIVINGGSVTINSADDGIVASYEGTGSGIRPYVLINGGTFNIKTTAEKGMGIKAIESVTVNYCTEMNITVSGNGSKAIKSAGGVVIANGILTLQTTGSAFYDTTDKDISSPAGINCDGNFQMKGGTLTIKSTGSAGKGISADGTCVIDGGILSVTTSGGQFKQGTNDSSAKAIKSEGNLTINGGTITIKTTGTEAEGIESKKVLTINSGVIEINAYDDCINAASSIVINGGNIYCYSTTNDGIDSNGTLTITGGTVISSGTTSPEEGFDCDNNTFKITGGTIVGVGGATSSPTSSACTQRSLVFGNSGTANQLINIQSGGVSILTFNIPRTYSQMTLLFSSDKITSGTTYTIYKGGSVAGGSEFHGLYTNGTYTPGTSTTTFTASSMVTTVGSTGGGGGRP